MDPDHPLVEGEWSLDYSYLTKMSIEVQHNSERRRFEIELEPGSAYLSYTIKGDSVSFDHTFVPDEFRGKGVAATLAREALEEARRRNWKIIPRCSYVAAFIERHPEFSTLVSGSPRT